MSLVYEKNNPNKEYPSKSSRYQVLRVVQEGDQRYLETYNQKTIPTVDSQDRYHVVEPSEEGRLDIIAHRYYGDSSYWWVIALGNEMINPFIVNYGDVLRIPSLMTLNRIGVEILSRRG